MISSTSKGIVSRLKLSFIYMVLEFSPKSCIVFSSRIASVGSLGFPISRIQRMVSTGVAYSLKCLLRRCDTHLIELTLFIFRFVSTVCTVTVRSHRVTNLTTAFTLSFPFRVTSSSFRVTSSSFLPFGRVVHSRFVRLSLLLVFDKFPKILPYP
jgi:hypothetical protein